MVAHALVAGVWRRRRAAPLSVPARRTRRACDLRCPVIVVGNSASAEPAKRRWSSGWWRGCAHSGSSPESSPADSAAPADRRAWSTPRMIRDCRRRARDACAAQRCSRRSRARSPRRRAAADRRRLRHDCQRRRITALCVAAGLRDRGRRRRASDSATAGCCRRARCARRLLASPRSTQSSSTARATRRPARSRCVWSRGRRYALIGGAHSALERIRRDRRARDRGIGNPQRFFQMLRDQGIEVLPHPLDDHAQISAADIVFADAKPVLMTEKDAVKCAKFADERHWVVPRRGRL